MNLADPLVCTPEKAIDCFPRTRIDVPAIGTFLIVKDRNPNEVSY